MKKKVVIIVATVMAVVAIGLGLGLGLGLERKIRFNSHINYGAGTPRFNLEVFRFDSVKDLEDRGLYYEKSGDKYFKKKSLIVVAIEQGFSDKDFQIDSITKKGKELRINLDTTSKSFGFGGEESWTIYIEVSKWDLRNVQDIKILIEMTETEKNSV